MMNSAVVIEFRTKTLSHACTFVMEGRPPCRPELLRAGQSPSFQCFCSPRVMKQILLGVTAVVPKVSLCERSKTRGVQFSRPREILFAQNPLDPDVDRERAQPLAGKQKHTLINLHTP